MINVLVIGNLESVENVTIMNKIKDLMNESRAFYKIRYVRSCAANFDKVVEILSESDLLMVIPSHYERGPYVDDFSYFRNFDNEQGALISHATNCRIPIIFL